MPECQRCGFGNPAQTIFCKRCQAPLEPEAGANGDVRALPTMPTIRVEQGGRHGLLPSLAPDNSRTQRLPPPRVPTSKTEANAASVDLADFGAATMMTPVSQIPPPNYMRNQSPAPQQATQSPTYAPQSDLRDQPQKEFLGMPQELELELELEEKPRRPHQPSNFRAPQGVAVSFPPRSAREATLPGLFQENAEEIGESTHTTPSPFANPGPQPPPRKPRAFETAQMPPSMIEALQQQHGISPSTQDLSPVPIESSPEATPSLQRRLPLPTIKDHHTEDPLDDDREDTLIATKAQREAQKKRSESEEAAARGMHTLGALNPALSKDLDDEDDEGETFVARPQRRPDKRPASTFQLSPPDAPLPSVAAPLPAATPRPFAALTENSPSPKFLAHEHTLAGDGLGAMLDADDEEEIDDEPTRRLNREQFELGHPEQFAPASSPSNDLLESGPTITGQPFVEPAPEGSPSQLPLQPLQTEPTTLPTPHSPLHTTPQPTPHSGPKPIEKPAIDRLIGQQFGNFRIEEKIGFGGFGTIYRATQLFLQQPIAVKVLHIDLQENTEVLARFRREAQALAQLRHDNIVQLSDFGLLPGLGFYIAMEYLEGESIHNRLKQEEPFELARIRFITEELCRVLGYVHQKGVIHRDMKPSNIILYQDDVRGERLKLIDFGIAAIQAGPAMAITKVGANLGTVRYMAPEQIMGSSTLDGRSDLYSVATIIFRMMTGQLPFEGNSDPMLLHQKTHNRAKKLSEVMPAKEWAPELIDFFQDALAKNPADRPDDAAHFWQKAETALTAQQQVERRQTGFDLVHTFSAPPPPSASLPVDLGPAFPQPYTQTPPDESLEESQLEEPEPTFLTESALSITSPPLQHLTNRPSSSKKWLTFFAIIVMLVLGGGAWFLWQHFQ